MRIAHRSAATHPEILGAQPEQAQDAQVATPGPPEAQSAALATLDRSVAAGLLTELQHGHGNAYCSRLARTALLQRDATTAAPAPTGVPPIKGQPGATLSSGEAVQQLLLKLYGADGLFDTMGARLQDFEEDMKTELGWYAGDKKASSKKKKGVDAAMEAASAAAKKKAKETITSGVKYLAGLLPRVGGPAGTAAGILAGVVWKQFDKIADYDPVVTEPAMKQPHQHYIEATDDARKAASRALVDELTANMDEMAAGSVDDVKAAIKLVDDAIQQIDARFYLDLVQGYRDVAPAKTVELETPHAQWTGEKRGLWGGGTYVTPISTGTVYVEFNAAGARPDDIKIVRTVVPELPSDVMERFDSAKSSLFLANLVESDELVIEGEAFGSNGWDVRIVKEAGTNELKLAQSPSYTKQFCHAVAREMGDHGSMDDAKAYGGAVNIYAKIISTPLSQAKLST